MSKKRGICSTKQCLPKGLKSVFGSKPFYAMMPQQARGELPARARLTCRHSLQVATCHFPRKLHHLMFLRSSKDPNSKLFATWLCKVLEAHMRAQNLTRADLPTQARTLHVGEFRHHGAAVAAAAPRCPPHSLHAAAQLRLSKAVNSSENALTGLLLPVAAV